MDRPKRRFTFAEFPPLPLAHTIMQLPILRRSPLRRFVLPPMAILLTLPLLPGGLIDGWCARSTVQADEPVDSQISKELNTEEWILSGGTAELNDRTLVIHVNDEGLSQGKVSLKRLCAPIRSMGWKGQPDRLLKFTPETDHWVFSWKRAPTDDPVVEVVFDHRPVLPEATGPIQAGADGSVMLHAYQAQTHGDKLRFEPQWYKNTVGYWTVPTDHVTWDLAIDQPGTFSVAILQGCGGGQGGSDALLSLSHGEQQAAEVPFETLETGHFQNFRWRTLGEVTLTERGPYQLRIAPKKIAKNALFDVRAVHLVRQAKSQ